MLARTQNSHRRRVFLFIFFWACILLLWLRSQANETATSYPNPAPIKQITVQSSTLPHTTSLPKLQNKNIQESPSKCSYNYPSLFDLKFSNIYWQVFESYAGSKTNFYLYNAYIDTRQKSSVRILAMINKIKPPQVYCLFWQSSSEAGRSKAQYVYAWYPKWGNYRDGFLQPFIITCPLPENLVPDSVTLVDIAPVISRKKRQPRSPGPHPILMPAFSSSAAPSLATASISTPPGSESLTGSSNNKHLRYDCAKTLPLTNNLPVNNQRPPVKQEFGVCVKGLDFPNEDISVRLVEWLELLELMGASKVFLYNLNINENTSRVLKYYERRGFVVLSQLTLPGDQPNLPEYQHTYLKTKTTSKRQNELIPYNDCLYRNLYSFKYLALLDIDEIIMPLGEETSWSSLMKNVETLSLRQQNYSRASYNFRNVYFFDDLSKQQKNKIKLKTTPSYRTTDEYLSRDQDINDEPVPSYLHMMQHVYRSKNYTKPDQYVKCFHNVERVVSLHNHFPLNCFGQCTTFSIPTSLAHLQHYRKDCVGPLRQSCKSEFRKYTQRDTTIWKYKKEVIKRATKALVDLNLIAQPSTVGLVVNSKQLQNGDISVSPKEIRDDPTLIDVATIVD